VGKGCARASDGRGCPASSLVLTRAAFSLLLLLLARLGVELQADKGGSAFERPARDAGKRGVEEGRTMSFIWPSASSNCFWRYFA
jgi:hypothetical protein